MKKGYLLFISLLLAACSLKAQDEKAGNKFDLQYGIHIFARQDQLFSPMIYHDASPVNLSLGYSNKKEQRLHFAEAAFTYYNAAWHDQYNYQTGFDSIKTQTTLPSGFTVVTVRYAYLRDLNVVSFGSWWIGGITDNEINSIDNEYGPSATFGYFAHFSIAPIVNWQYQLADRHVFHASSWLPLVSWIARSPYAIQNEEYMINNQNHNGFKTFWNYLGDGNLHLINRYQQFNLNCDYQYSISGHWNIGAEYRFEFFHDSKPEPVISYQNFFNLKASFLF